MIANKHINIHISLFIFLINIDLYILTLVQERTNERELFDNEKITNSICFNKVNNLKFIKK